MLEVSIAEQTWMFLYSLALGAGFGLLYDVFRIVRIAVPHHPVAVAAEDLLFWCMAAAGTLLFFLCTDGGRIRIFLLIGELLGFIIYYFTIGVLVIGAARRIIAVIRWILIWIYRIFIRPVHCLVRWIGRYLSKWNRIIKKYYGKQVKNSNIHLQKYKRILYNYNKHLGGYLGCKFQEKDSVTNESTKNTKE